MDKGKTHYDVLGLKTDASVEEIRDAYRRLAMKWHPDRNIEQRAAAEAMFKEIGYAYKVLSDPDQRAYYDASLERDVRANQSRGRPDEGISGADASQLFFEQMLELAVQLAKHGYSAPIIHETLIGLGCPVTVARGVAAVASSAGSRRTSEPQRQNSSGLSGNGASSGGASADDHDQRWVEIEPFFAAVIGGEHADNRMSQAEYDRKHATMSRLGWWGYGISAVLFVSSIIALSVQAANSFVPALKVLGILGAIFTAIARASYGGWDYYREHAMRHYLGAFRRYYLARPEPQMRALLNFYAGFFGHSWFAFRRMPVHAVIALGLYVAMAIGFTTVLGEQSRMAQLLTGGIPFVTLMVLGSRLYYARATELVETVRGMPTTDALISLRRRGGTNAWSWLLFVLIPTAVVMYLSFQEASSVAQERAFDAALAQVTARHPEIDDRSPQFNQELVNELLQRIDVYVGQGLPRDKALLQAVSDMEQGRN